MIRTFSALTSDLNANPGRLANMQAEAFRHGIVTVATRGPLTIVTAIVAADYNI